MTSFPSHPCNNWMWTESMYTNLETPALSLCLPAGWSDEDGAFWIKKIPWRWQSNRTKWAQDPVMTNCSCPYCYTRNTSAPHSMPKQIWRQVVLPCHPSHASFRLGPESKAKLLLPAEASQYCHKFNPLDTTQKHPNTAVTSTSQLETTQKQPNTAIMLTFSTRENAC